MKIKKQSGYCVPHALKFLCGLSDNEIMAVCKNNGWAVKWGMEEWETLKAVTDLKIKHRRMCLKKNGLYGDKLGRFAKEINKGTYLVWTPGHILIVSNGVIIDPINEGYIGEDRAVTAAVKIFK